MFQFIFVSGLSSLFNIVLNPGMIETHLINKSFDQVYANKLNRSCTVHKLVSLIT
jgi:hypothetical protein